MTLPLRLLALGLVVAIAGFVVGYFWPRRECPPRYDSTDNIFERTIIVEPGDPRLILRRDGSIDVEVSLNRFLGARPTPCDNDPAYISGEKSCHWFDQTTGKWHQMFRPQQAGEEE